VRVTGEDLCLLQGQPFRVAHGETVVRWRALKQTDDMLGWYCFPLDSKPGKAVPSVLSTIALAGWRASGALTPLRDADVPNTASPNITMSEAVRSAFEARVAKVNLVLRHELHFLDKQTRPALLTILHDQHGLSASSVLALMDRYYRYGMTRLALRPRFEERGGRGCARGSHAGATYVIDDDDETILSRLIADRNSTKTNRLSAGEIQAAFVGKKAAMLGIEITQSTTVTDLPPSVSLRQVEYRIARSQRTPADQAKHLTESQLNAKYRPRTGVAAERGEGPGSVYEVDCWHISEQDLLTQNRSELLPTVRMWIAVDVSTGQAMNRVAHLRPESSASLLSALYHMFVLEPDDASSESQAICLGVPARIRLDGISRTYAVDDVVQLLGLEIETTPPGRGDKKPFVESVNASMRVKLVKGNPGAQLEEERERDLPRSEAALTLPKFLVEYDNCARAYNQSPVNKRQWPPQLTGLHPSHPSRERLFSLGEQVLGIQRRFVPVDDLRRVLLPKEDAEVYGEGIDLHGLRFSCATADREGWFYRKMRGRPKTVSVIYDPMNCTRAWYQNAETSQLERLVLQPGQQGCEGLHVVEWGIFRAHRTAQLTVAKKEADRASILAQLQNETINSAAVGELSKARAAERKQKKSELNAAAASDEGTAAERRIFEEGWS
jgi:hypothetical protein